MKFWKSALPLCLASFLLFTKCVDSMSPARRIRQSNQVFEDNVNGRIMKNIIESTNFYYNGDGSLGRVTVYDDTTVSATLLKDYSIIYQDDSSRIVVFTYDRNFGNKTLYFYYNAKKELTELRDTLGYGLLFTYSDDKITSITDSSDAGINHYLNFTYDANNNLTQYELAPSINPPTYRAVLEYNTDPITDELDTRFFNKSINYIYIGGLNLINKLGLNTGMSSTNTLIRRSEIKLATGDTTDVYRFGYIYSTDEIIKRNFQYKDDTLFYQFKYY